MVSIGNYKNINLCVGGEELNNIIIHDENYYIYNEIHKDVDYNNFNKENIESLLFYIYHSFKLDPKIIKFFFDNNENTFLFLKRFKKEALEGSRKIR